MLARFYSCFQWHSRAAAGGIRVFSTCSSRNHYGFRRAAADAVLGDREARRTASGLFLLPCENGNIRGLEELLLILDASSAPPIG